MQISRTERWELIDNDGNKMDSNTQTLFADLVDLLTSEYLLGRSSRINKSAAMRVALLVMNNYHLAKLEKNRHA